MRTVTDTYNVYTFDELSEEAKQKAHEDYLRDHDYWFWGSEATDTMKEVEKLFQIRLGDWCIDTYRPEYPSVRFLDNFGDLWEQDERRELKGNRARAFLWNNFGHVLTSPRTKYFCHDKNGKRFEAVGANCVSIKSNVFTTRVYDGTCPLTGVYFDCCALDPLAYFCFGVEWNEKEQRRTMTTDRTIRHDDRTTVEDVIKDCVRSMFKSFVDDMEDAESRERFAENCEANNWEFLENGEMA